MPKVNNEPCFTCGKLVNDWSYPCDYGCDRVYCSAECADQVDVNDQASGIYWCPACKEEFEKREMNDLHSRNC